MKTIAIYGGSFNPPTLGHKSVVDYVLHNTLVDEVWIMPCYEHKFKDGLVSFNHRFQMCWRMFNSTKVVIKDTEFKHSLDGSTYKLLNTIPEFKDNKYIFRCIIGQDNADSIETWENYEKLIDEVSFIIIPRGDKKPENKWYIKAPHVYLYDFNQLNISSSEVRKNITNNPYLHHNVLEYIKEENLYEYRRKDCYPKASNTSDIIVYTIHPSSTIIQILLIQRKNDPFKGCWALPGGFLDIITNELDLEACAIRELEEETNIKKEDVGEFEQLGTYSNVYRDPRDRVISTVFYTQLLNESADIKAQDDASNLEWFDVNNLPELAFDHNKIISDFKKRM